MNQPIQYAATRDYFFSMIEGESFFDLRETIRKLSDVQYR